MICSKCLRSVTDKQTEFKLWHHVADGSLMCEDAEAIEDEMPEHMFYDPLEGTGFK